MSGAEGPSGPSGPQGTTGASGPTGPSGPTGAGLTAVEQVTAAAAADVEGPRTSTVDCPAGKIVIGGGFVTTLVSDSTDIAITFSAATDSNTWSVSGDNSDAGGGDQSYALFAFAICAQP